jgi:hypothetical protein
MSRSKLRTTPVPRTKGTFPAYPNARMPANIAPIQDIRGEFATCDKCTWVAIGYRLHRLKYINRACRIHGSLRCG